MVNLVSDAHFLPRMKICCRGHGGPNWSNQFRGKMLAAPWGGIMRPLRSEASRGKCDWRILGRI